MPGPTFIECDRVDLRRAENDDVAFLQEGVTHPDVRRYVSAFRRPYSREEYREEFESGDGVGLRPRRERRIGSGRWVHRGGSDHDPSSVERYDVWLLRPGARQRAAYCGE